MSFFLTPLAGLLLAAAVIPPLIVLYFLKLRRKPQAISCTILWKKSIEDLRANAPFQKLRKSLLLFLQLLALLLLAMSVMQPQIQAGGQGGGKTVILIDNSASMSATDAADGDATRLAEAKRRAKEQVEKMYGAGLFASTSGETMVIGFSDQAEIYSRFTTSRQQLLAAIDRIQPTHGETRLAEALQLAAAYTTNTVDPNTGELRPLSDPPTLELYSDGRISDQAEQVLKNQAMHYHAIGTTDADNVALATISVDRPYDRPTQVEVFVSLLNFNQDEVECDLQISVDDTARGIQTTRISGAELDSTSGKLLPGRANVVFTPFEQPRGAVIEIANLREDKLMADNAAQLVVPAPRQLRVGLVSSNRSLVKVVLEGMKILRSLESLSPEQYEKLAAEGGLDGFDVVVLDNYKPTVMPPGRYLTLGLTPPVEGLTQYGEAEGQFILTSKDEHPALRFVNHDNVYISQFSLIQPSQDVQVLWEGSKGPALLAISRGPMQVIHVAFDPLQSTWPLGPSFLMFIYNAVEYLGNSGEALTAKGFRPGEALTARLPAGATDIQLLTPDSQTPIKLTGVDPTQFAWGPIRLSGIHTITWKSPGEEDGQRELAVNLLSETEGQIATQSEITVGVDRVAGRQRDEAAYTPLWPWAIGVCLALLMVEWWVYHRKAYI